MALRLGAPTGEPAFGRNVAATTAATLHLDVASGGVAPPGVNHLPCGVMFNAAGNFNWVDASGTDITTVVTAESVGILCPIAPAALQSDNAVAVTVFWRR